MAAMNDNKQCAQKRPKTPSFHFTTGISLANVVYGRKSRLMQSNEIYLYKEIFFPKYVSFP